MRRYVNHSALFAAAFLLCACASAPPAKQPTATDLIGDTGELPAQTLAPDACGLFLWTKGEPRRFVFFNEAGSDQAVMKLKGVETALQRAGSGGEIFGQFMTRMTYNGPDGTVSMEIEPGEKLEGGQRIDTGRLVMTNKEGWETILPVLGLRACQTSRP